jgi:hypothetical protein
MKTRRRCLALVAYVLLGLLIRKESVSYIFRQDGLDRPHVVAVLAGQKQHGVRAIWRDNLHTRAERTPNRLEAG